MIIFLGWIIYPTINELNLFNSENKQHLEMMGKKILERDPYTEILKAFELFDKDHNGKISLKDLKSATIELGENLTDDELREMIREADRDFDGEVGKNEFVEVMKKSGLFGTFEEENK